MEMAPEIIAKELAADSPETVAGHHTLTIRRCEISERDYLSACSDSETISLRDAVARLAPTKTNKARANILRAKSGQYIGVYASDGSNFVIANPTSDGDVRWLLVQRPELRTLIKEVYLVESVSIQRATTDVGVTTGAGGF